MDFATWSRDHTRLDDPRLERRFKFTLPDHPPSGVSLEEWREINRMAAELVAGISTAEMDAYLAEQDERIERIFAPPPDGGLMLTPRKAPCLVEREIWNVLRAHEHVIERDLGKLLRREEKVEAKAKEGFAPWTLGYTGATACWDIAGHSVRPHPTLDQLDGNWS